MAGGVGVGGTQIWGDVDQRLQSFTYEELVLQVYCTAW